MRHRGQTLTAIEAAELRALVERIGERQALQYLEIGAATLARAIGLMHVQRGTIALIRQRLADPASADRTSAGKLLDTEWDAEQ